MMSTDLEMLNNLVYSDGITEKLSLSEMQLYALTAEVFEEMSLDRIIQAIGITAEEAEEWQSNPFWLVCFHIKGDVPSSSFVSCFDAVQAGFLASIGAAYKDIEILLGLPSGEIVRWLNSEWEEEPSTDAGRKHKAFHAAEGALWSMKLHLKREGMSDKQRQALPLILAGKTDKEVGEAVGVCRETVSDWKHLDHFKSMLNAERERLVVVNRERLGTLFEKACASASELMDSADERIRLQATLGVLKALKDVALPVQSPSQQNVGIDAHMALGMLSQLGALKGLPNPK